MVVVMYCKCLVFHGDVSRFCSLQRFMLSIAFDYILFFYQNIHTHIIVVIKTCKQSFTSKLTHHRPVCPCHRSATVQ